MMGLGGMISRVRARLGDLWWFTLLLFFAQRFSDVINMVVGLWLVPKYVPQQELGAVMPLTQYSSFLAIPLTIVAIPFIKYLGVFAAKGEMGRVKAFLRDVFIGTLAMGVVTFFIAWLTIPFFFTRLRVATGSLGLIVVGMSLIGAVANIFQSAVQGLKLFSMTVWFNLLIAPVRLVTMLVTMPFRAISGYFVGQGASQCVPVIGGLWQLHKRLKGVRAEPYWSEYGGEILRYTFPNAIGAVLSVICLSMETLVIRRCLTDFESAGYYMISTFASIATYLGSAFVVFLFPLVANGAAKGTESLKILRQSLWGTLGAGFVTALLLLVSGSWILGLTAHWKVYESLTTEMFLLTVYQTVTVACTCLSTYEVAQCRFRFIWYTSIICFIRAAGLYAVTGYSFFRGFLPDAWIDAIVQFNPCRLSFVLLFQLVFSVLCFVCMFYDVFYTRRRVVNA